MNKNKKVIFSEKIKLSLIPKYENEMKYELWWNTFDKYNATIVANIEINTLLNRHTSMTYKQALKLLYQPNNISYNESNFE